MNKWIEFRKQFYKRMFDIIVQANGCVLEKSVMKVNDEFIDENKELWDVDISLEKLYRKLKDDIKIEEGK
jgi:hypothetical protein